MDPILLNPSAILLKARCGMGDHRPADGFGLVSGFSTSGGSFVYDAWPFFWTHFWLRSLLYPRIV